MVTHHCLIASCQQCLLHHRRQKRHYIYSILTPPLPSLPPAAEMKIDHSACAVLSLVTQCGWVATGLHVFDLHASSQLSILWLDVGPRKIGSQDCNRVTTEFAL